MMMSERFTGTVRWFSQGKGYGYFCREGGEAEFVYYAPLEAGGYRPLAAGQRVEFSLQPGPAGPQATDIAVLAH